MTIEYKDSKRIVGLSTDKIPSSTYETDFSTVSDWSIESGGITYVDNIHYNHPSSVAMNTGVIHDLTTANVSETSWTLDYDLNITTSTGGSGSSCQLFIGLSNNATVSSSAIDTTQDYLGHFMIEAAGTHAIRKGNGSDSPEDPVGTVFSRALEADVLYCRLQRISATLGTLSLYSDQGRTSLIESENITITTSLAGLRYLKVILACKTTSGSHVMVGDITNMKFWNTITSGIESKPTNVQDNSILVEKDTAKRYWFDEATPITYPASGVLPTGTTTTDWTLTGTTISSSALNFNSAQASTQNDGVYDLGTALSDTAFVVRFKYTIANLTSGNQSNINAYLGLFSGTGNFLASQDYIGLSYFTASSTNYFYANAENNSAIDETGSTGRIYDGSVSATTYYVEIKRTGATSGEISIGTNSDFTTGRTTQTTFQNGIVAGITGLRYIGIKNRSNVPTLGSAVFNGTISDIEVYNGVTSITPATWTKELYPFTSSFWAAGGTASAWTAGNFHDEFSGSTWSTASALSTSVSLTAGAGTKSDGSIFGGDTGGWSSPSAITQEWNGSSWSAGGVLSTARHGLTGGGSGTSDMLAVAGYTGSNISSTEEYNGTAWSAGGAISTARRTAAGGGIISNFWIAGGEPSNLSSTEEYNGTSWSAGANLTVGLSGLTSAGAGQTDEGWFTGGYNGSSNTDDMKLYNGTAWSAGGLLSVDHKYVYNGGSQSNAIAAMGNDSSWAVTWAELYNGTAWSTTGSVSSGRSTGAGGN